MTNQARNFSSNTGSNWS